MTSDREAELYRQIEDLDKRIEELKSSRIGFFQYLITKEKIKDPKVLRILLEKRIVELGNRIIDLEIQIALESTGVVIEEPNEK